MLGERFIRAFVAVKRKEYETYFGDQLLERSSCC